MAGLFQVLKGQSDGSFLKAQVLNGTDKKPLIIPVEGDNWVENICTRPFAVDWDGDGNLDIVSGNFTGTFYLFKGEGKGKFKPEAEQIKTGDQPLKVDGYHSDPFVIDYDGDGDLDLLSGTGQGGLQLAENQADPGKPPELKPFRAILEPGKFAGSGNTLRDSDLTGPAHATRVWVDDVNGDGKLDILLGDNVTLVSPADGLTDEQFKEKFAEWQTSFAEAQKKLTSGEVDAKERAELQRSFQQLYNDRSKFMKEERTGFVWLYLQK